MSNREIIRQIALYRCPVKLTEPFIISLGRLEYADNIIVVIKTSGGIIGFGECSPFQTIHGENGFTCMAVGKILGETLINKNAIDVEHCSLLMDSIIFGNTSIKSAFDIALHDIASQRAEMPLYRFLGGENNKELITDYTVSIDTVEKMTDDSIKIVKNGFKIVKVKLGGNINEDIRRITAIRNAIGFEIPMRIDANQGWEQEDAIKILNQLYDFNIQHCEEPISRNQYMRLSEIKMQSKIPIMADESCFDHYDADRLINLNACDSLNVKLGKSSGIFKAMKIAKLAEENNINMQAGGFLESRLGFTAAAHLALSSNRFIYFDFDTPLMFSEDMVTDGIKYLKNGKIEVPEINGLGASIDEKYLNKCERIII